MTRYQVLIADPLLGMGLQWPDGMRLAGQLGPGGAGTHWHLMEDPEAPGELEGKRVELTLRRDEDGRAQVAERRVIVTHLCPQDDGGLMPCCGLPALKAPRSDTVTGDTAAVTCGGGEAP